MVYQFTKTRLVEVKKTINAQTNAIIGEEDLIDKETENAFREAKERFEKIARGGVPDQMPEVSISSEKFKDDRIGIVALAVEAGFAASNGEARRLIQNRGLRLNGETISDDKLNLELLEPVVLQKGKNDFKRLKRV